MKLDDLFQANKRTYDGNVKIASMKVKIKEQMKKFWLYIKSHCEYPDWEDDCEARNKTEAIKIFLKRMNVFPDMNWTADMIKNDIEEVK